MTHQGFTHREANRFCDQPTVPNILLAEVLAPLDFSREEGPWIFNHKKSRFTIICDTH